jgi:CheY-like chemotaxis protein
MSSSAINTCIDGAAYTPKLRILLIDDHTMLRSGLKALLSAEFRGADFGEAADGAEAFERLCAQPWDIALLDISLPGRSGLDLLKELKAGWPQLRVLVLSGHRVRSTSHTRVEVGRGRLFEQGKRLRRVDQGRAKNHGRRPLREPSAR